MPQFQSVRFSEQGQGLFSPAEVEHLMRAEFDRAQRHTYPIVCMMIGIDRIGQLQDLYGYDSKDEILRAVIGVLRTATRDSDFLGFQQDDRLLAVFPHTAPETAGLLARRLLAGAKKLRFDRDGRNVGISMSVGIAHNRHEGSLSFDTLVRVAEEGLAVADAAGGDRFVETELYQLYERKRKARLAGRDVPEPLFTEPARAAFVKEAPEPAIPQSRLSPEAEQALLLRESLLDVLRAEGYSEEMLANLDRDKIALLIRNLREQKERATSPEEIEEYKRQIDLFERRIAKLTHELGITEDELKRIATMKGIDLGLTSIYRTVQGLSDAEGQRELKREMMREIFEANFELKQKISSGTERPADHA